MIRDLLRTALPILVAIFGAVASGPLSSGFLAPGPVDRNDWNVLFRGDSDQHLRSPRLGEGTQIANGALSIGQDRFGQSEMISPKDTRPISQLEILTARDSGPIQVAFRLRGAEIGEHLVVTLDQNSFTAAHATQGSRANAHWTIRKSGEKLLIETGSGPITLHEGPVGTVELSSPSASQARITWIRIEDESGEVLLEADHSTSPLHLGALGIGTFSGLLLGLGTLVLLQQRRPVKRLMAAVFTLGPPLSVLGVETQAWNTLTDKLYLLQTPPTDLALAILGAAHIPVLALLLLDTKLLSVQPRRGSRNHWQIWAAVGLILALLGLRSSWGWAIGLALFGVLPGWLTHRARLPDVSALVLDAPSILTIAWLGGPLGLLPATLWRMLVLTANRAMILQRSPRAAADYLFVLLVALPCTLELAVRGTSANQAWDPKRLALESPSDGVSDWRNPSPYWSSGCGPKDAIERFSLVFLGGSSAGGAFQFAEEPEAFFPARIHDSICKTLPDTVRLETFNFAEGGRNSFTFSRSIERILDQASPDFVVAYVGVNERTANHPWTRKQMEEREENEGPAEKELGRLAGLSRTVVGLSLLTRASEHSSADGERVSEVPVVDFRENLVTIQRAIGNARLLLVTQVVLGSLKDDLVPYWEVEADLAESMEGVYHTRLGDKLRDLDPETAFFDQNHLTREGHSQIHDALLPTIRDLADLPLLRVGIE